MTRRGSSIGLFGLFGRSGDLRQLDAALRGADLHPALVPEGVKLVIVNLMKDEWGDAEAPPQAYPAVAELFAYCVAGPEAFARANGAASLARAQVRVTAAPDDPDGLDARLILLTLHAGLADAQIVALHDLRAEED